MDSYCYPDHFIMCIKVSNHYAVHLKYNTTSTVFQLKKDKAEEGWHSNRYILLYIFYVSYTGS